ncbi:hypothetical protein TELCIR_08682 [Teladorsagia circumcincta]|uniref:Uncharacterized protein n=1 Tax=Teladorsagia circumcincta TaxID=45464 RepID=A0A2G9UH31_TELCI|nr:hypothetical protein TELCIR_08682 [Teladorsagia circumcincta]
MNMDVHFGDYEVTKMETDQFWSVGNRNEFFTWKYIHQPEVEESPWLLRPLNVPMIEDETEVGHHIGAVVDVTDRDGVVEFGDRLKVFKGLRLNNGGIAEWDRAGAGVDVGSRLSAADDIAKVRWTLLGVNVGPTASRTIVGPGPLTLGRAKGAALKTYTPFPSFYRGYYERGDWYRNQFYNQGNEYKTPAQRACPWCFAVDSTYPIQQRLFP